VTSIVVGSNLDLQGGEWSMTGGMSSDRSTRRQRHQHGELACNPTQCGGFFNIIYMVIFIKNFGSIIDFFEV
jgi:hypothetical protein